MRAEDFRRFFEALHDREPFPWQERLAARLCTTPRSQRAWPETIDLPTGAGKTSCIDIALFHWLVCASNGETARAARRIAFVVDRRIIVDEAEDRARRIEQRIGEHGSPLLAEAADILARETGSGTIEVFKLRGGVERERNLVRDPTTVAVVLSTVDQLGSRLLFRGYGVSDYAKPMHAGIFGMDTLVLLDEAHIAEPFRQTVEGIVREQGRSPVGTLGSRPLELTQLSATPAGPAPSFTIDAHDRANETLAKRLRAQKPMRLIEVEKREALAKSFARLVEEEIQSPRLSEEEQPRIAVVVNRVGTAREVFSGLQRTLGNAAELELLIGRVRPLDRERQLRHLSARLKASERPRAGDKPIVVVATQTIEVGADFDFHALFTEGASYAALRQRVGRLNRLGLRAASRGAIVFVRADAEDDPLYGSTLGKTWELLRTASRNGAVDLGIDAAPQAVAGVMVAPPMTPVLSGPVLHLLVQTSPRPAVEPEVSALLHGFAADVPDVSVVWRDGISADDVSMAERILDLVPPISAEAMSIPYRVFRAWVRSRVDEKRPKMPDYTDVEGAKPADEDSRVPVGLRGLLVSSEGVEPVELAEVRPGALLVVPTTFGGTDQYGFAPASTHPVVDLSLTARLTNHRTPILVCTRALANTWLRAELASEHGESFGVSLDRLLDVGEDDDIDALRARLDEWLEAWTEMFRSDVADTVALLRKDDEAVCEAVEIGGRTCGVLLRGRRPTREELVEQGGGLQRTVRVTLAEHSQGVADFAERFASRLGLDASLVEDLRVAGFIHDIGKADPRFQARLCARPGETLAKSSRYDRRVSLGHRHEVYSVALIDRHPALLEGASDKELVRYLVGSHHGRGRGMQPVREDSGVDFEVTHDGQTLRYVGRPQLAALDSGWAETFVRLTKKYGPWGLAFLETVLRLADHRRSEAEIEEATR